jgi:S-adenosylmethionine synthetase
MRLARVPLAGHPDHVCDLIAAGIADEYLRRDPDTRIRCHVSGGLGAIFVTGEVLTKADFDVSHLVQRLLGQYGIYEAMEPFVALEHVSSEQVRCFRFATTEPLLVTGYATNETESFLPAPMHWAKKLAATLELKRKNDQDWFWLGSSGWVSVLGDGKSLHEITVQVDHGAQPIEIVRGAITLEFEDMGGDKVARLKVNPLGESIRQGIESSIGNSQSIILPYGQNLPMAVNPAGRDWHAADVTGAWLARHAAKKILQATGSQAVMTELVYLPGEDYPAKITARDERGRDVSQNFKWSRETLAEKVAGWRKTGLMSEAVKANLVGDFSLPWERTEA